MALSTIEHFGPETDSILKIELFFNVSKSVGGWDMVYFTLPFSLMKSVVKCVKQVNIKDCIDALDGKAGGLA